MTRKKSKKINWRAFTSMLILFSFLVIGITGIVLYFAPPGRIAHWSNWKFISLTKEGWQAVHTIFSFTFIATAVFHLKFNWKPLMAYLKKKIQEGRKVRKEFAFSGILSIAILTFTLAEVPPFSTVMDWGAALSNSWANEQTEPPVPHAESMTLEELSKATQIPLQEVLKQLKQAGIEPENTNSIELRDLAAQYALTPQQLYEEILAHKKTASASVTVGGGYGRKNISEICEDINTPISICLEKLRSHGIGATADSNIRELASKHSKNPIDIVSMMQSNDSKLAQRKSD